MLEAYSYVAMLYCKPSELEALSHLDSAIKPNMFPILGVRPGQHNDFREATQKVKKAAEGLRVALTFDESKYGKAKRSPAKEQFDALFNPLEGFQEFFDFVRDWEAAIPVLCSIDGIFENAAEQVANAQQLDRGLLVRVRQHEYAHFSDLLDAGIFDNIDCAFAIDGEWSRDVLQAEGWMSRAIGKITTWSDTAEIVCLSSSFPKDFSHVKDKAVFSNDDRDLFDRLRRRHNDANLLYGDWGSTRSSEETIANTPRPRIDLATQREWISFRQGDKEATGYVGQAQKAKSDRVWASTPECWGKRKIELTALQRPTRIVGTYSANAARINLHLTVQAMTGTMEDIPEEPFTDNF